LAEGEIEIESGAVASGLAHLSMVAQDATDKGFGLIAQEASTTLRANSRTSITRLLPAVFLHNVINGIITY
jgi:hypothetical protein